KPTVAAEQTPQKSQRLVETSPTAAEGSAPKRPTIAASIYCIKMLDSCAMIAGHARRAVKDSRWRNVNGCPDDMSSIFKTIIPFLILSSTNR
ncbi:MAG: hypothetical protein K2M53_03890, partial [Muribaculaceae bacterium]|nr:hypothetical protein [Muribaculaceae bacterium]